MPTPPTNPNLSELARKWRNAHEQWLTRALVANVARAWPRYERTVQATIDTSRSRDDARRRCSQR